LNASGAEAGELARIYGTPLVVVDLDTVDGALAALHAACTPFDIEISYAAKAFLCIQFARYLARDAAIGLDVCSLGELLVAERAGLPSERLTLHGAGKSDEELVAAAQGRVGRIVVDGIEELERLGAMQSCQARLLLRINTGIEAHTHAFVRTGGDDTKFGIARRDLAQVAQVLREHPHLRFTGLHAHAGSQIYEPDAFAANAAALMEAAASFVSAGLAVTELVAGGGFGVQMQPEMPTEKLDVAAAVAGIAKTVRENAASLRIPMPRIGIEPGRAIVANAGTTLYRVVAVKRQTSRTFVVVDGGLFENPRPALYGAYHHVAAVRTHAGELHDVTLCGRSCENDVLGTARLPVDLRAGDLLAMFATGAYTFSMAGNYNRFARPAVVAVRGTAHDLWIRRETLDDVLRNDVDA